MRHGGTKDTASILATAHRILSLLWSLSLLSPLAPLRVSKWGIVLLRSWQFIGDEGSLVVYRHCSIAHTLYHD